LARSGCKHHARRRPLEHVQLGHPPLAVAITRCRRTHESAVRQEIEFIDIKISRRDEFERRAVDFGDTLFIRFAADIAHQRNTRLRAAHHLVRFRGRQHRKPVARAVTQSIQGAVET